MFMGKLWITEHRNHAKYLSKLHLLNSLSVSACESDFCKVMSLRTKESFYQFKFNDGKKKPVCPKCYDFYQVEAMFKDLKAHLIENGNILSSEVLPERDLPIIQFQYENAFRLDSFGDIINDIHYENYMNIINKNPQTNFALWTKRVNIAHKWLDKYSKPSNLILIYSNFHINNPLTELDLPKKFNKIFSAFEPKFVEENEVEINCGKFCIDCMKCYEPEDDTIFMNEFVKMSNRKK